MIKNSFIVFKTLIFLIFNRNNLIKIDFKLAHAYCMGLRLVIYLFIVLKCGGFLFFAVINFGRPILRLIN